MLKNYFKIAWRNVYKHKFYTGINVFGLGLSLACSVVLFEFIIYHTSFDRYHNNAENIYRVVHSVTFDDGIPIYDQGAPLALARDLQANDSHVRGVSILLQIHDINVIVNPAGAGKRKLFAEHENIGITDERFFKIFDYTWEQGNKSTALQQPNNVVLSNSIAQKYFGTQNVVGKTITIDNKHLFTITGIVADHPSNTDIKQDIFLSLSSLNNLYPEISDQLKNNWNFINSTNSVYFVLQDGVSPKTVEQSISRLSVKTLGPDISKAYQFMLLPLADMHFDGRFTGVIQRSLLIALGIIAVMLVVVACVNFINMAIAQSFKRAKEVGTRKVLGSSPRAIFIQFICETTYIVFFAGITAIGAVILIAPVVNTWLQTDVSFNFLTDFRLIIFFLLTLIVIVIASGSYPALVLSNYSPVNALKNKVGGIDQADTFGRKALIVFQNVVAQVLIVSTILVTLQVKYLKTTNPGFDKENVLMIYIPDNTKTKTDYLRNQLLADPAIKNVSFCYRAPSSTSMRGGSIKYDDRPWEKFAGNEITGDANYVQTFSLKLTAGRPIAESDTAREYLINEATMHQLGINDPQQVLGKKFTAGNLSNTPGTIVGVVKDFHSRSLYTAIGPEYISSVRKNYEYAGIKLASGNPTQVIQRIKKQWEQVYPDNVFEYNFLDQQLADFYKKEELLNKLISTSALIAIAISSLGILGLISLMAVQRTKEIGIRKVLGANVANITAMLSKDFIKLVLIAVLIASPVAFGLMHKWLQGFAYRVDLEWWHFALSATVSVILAFMALSVQSVKAALANPVDSLRNE